MSLSRRDFLKALETFCVSYGMQSLLSPYTFGATASTPKRLVNFVIKYTGGCTDKDGVGKWTTSDVLSPLNPYANELAVILGTTAEFNAPMNSHAAPQVCALSGAMTNFIMRETEYPTGNLVNFTSGEGKSMDVLIGEKLQSIYKTKIPYLLIGSSDAGNTNIEHCTITTSSWGKNGELLHSIKTIEGLRSLIEANWDCQRFDKSVYQTRLQALEHLKKNNKVFNSSYLVDKVKFQEIEGKLQDAFDRYKANIKAIDEKGRLECKTFPKSPEFSDCQTSRDLFNKKMDKIYDLCVDAFTGKITNVITINLWLLEAHERSHHSTTGLDGYLDISKFYQTSIASFINRLKVNNLYNDTMIFCNAGSGMHNDVHNFENLSTYVINSGVSGVRGSAADKKPIGSLLLDIMKKFDVNFSEYGGSNHLLGSGKPGKYI